MIATEFKNARYIFYTGVKISATLNELKKIFELDPFNIMDEETKFSWHVENIEGITCVVCDTNSPEWLFQEHDRLFDWCIKGRKTIDANILKEEIIEALTKVRNTKKIRYEG